MVITLATLINMAMIKQPGTVMQGEDGRRGPSYRVPHANRRRRYRSKPALGDAESLPLIDQLYAVTS